MKIKEIKSQSVKELEALLAASRLQLKDLRFKDANRALKDVREIRETKKLIAQILTVLKEQAKK
jgi:large subunit ribosomal protein L29